MAHRLKIGVDIDGVLITMDTKQYLEFCAKQFGWNASYDVYVQTHSWIQATGQTDDALISHAWGVYLETIENAQQPIEGAHDVLRALGNSADIYLITARPVDQLEATEAILRKHLPDVKYIELSMSNRENKIQPIIDFNIDYYIDDSYSEISAILENKNIQTNIIPFPSFHATTRWDGLEDDRLIWLKAWDSVEVAVSDEEKKGVYRKAWEEIGNIIQRGKRI